MPSYDAIILGSGCNELVAACVLAKAGKRVLLVEARAEPGGTAALQEIASGFRVQLCPPSADWIAPKLVRALGLEAHGLPLEPVWADPCVCTPRRDGPPFVLWRDLARSQREIAAHSSADAEKWPAFCTRMARLAGFLETLYTEAPPRIMSHEVGDLLALMGVGLRLRRLGKTDMVELLRTLPMSVQDLLDDWFECDALKAMIGAGAIANLCQGPRSAGTSFVLLHHLVGRPLGAFRVRSIPSGGERGHLVSVLLRAAAALGVEVRTGTAAKIVIKDGRATGVVLASGDELSARAVVSGADPKRTFLELVDPTELEPELVRAVQHVKLRGVRAIVNLALDGLPEFRPALDERLLHGVISIAPDLDYLERAYDDAKHGGISKGLVLEATLPSCDDPSLAPPGKHVMSIAVQYVPYHLRSGDGGDAGWGGPTREQLADRVIATLAEYAPNLPKIVLARQVYTPPDLEQHFGLTEGHLYGGELTLDQILFMRPIPGWAHYRTPLDALFLCGDATHPGGGLPGLAGANAARQILKWIAKED